MKQIPRYMGILLVMLGLSWPAYAVDDYKPLATLQNAAAATGNGTALDVAGYGTVAVQVTISATATVTFEGSSDGSTWASVVCSSTDSTSATLATSATATGLYQCSVSGLSSFRARISSFGSGTVTVTARAVRMSLGKRGGSTGGGGSASAAGSTGAVQSNNGGALADSGCTSTASSGKMTCANGFVASVATVTALTVTNSTGSGLLVYGSSPTLTTPNLGTPSAATLSNATGLPISSGVTGLGTGVATMLGTPSSANVAAALTDETGTGRAVFGSSPTLTTPNLGIPSQIFLVNGASMPATGLTGTLPIGNGGTGSTSYTGGRCVQVNAGGTAFISASGACGTAASGASSSGASGVVQSADGSGGLVSSGCTTSIGGQMTCPGGFVAGTSALGVIALTQGTATVAGATTGQHNIWIDSTDGVLHSYGYGAASAATYVTTQIPATFWNKTYNAEATGNLLTIVREYRFPAAGANGTTAGSVWNLPTTNPAVASAIQGTNVIQGVLNFPAAADTSAQIEHWISRFWDGGQVDAELTWMATPTTGTVVMNLQTVCIADGATNDPSFNATSANNTFTDAVKGTTLQTNLATVASLTMTGCSPGNRLILKLRRASAPTDTMAGAPASVLNLKLWFRELMRKVTL